MFLRAIMLAFILLAALPTAAIADPKTQDIPEEFRGTWGLSLEACRKGEGPELVRIGPRHIFFVDASGYLNLAQLNHISDPPSFHGEFSFAGELEFWRQVIRLDLTDGQLFITHLASREDEPSATPWVKCR
ncbi:MAG TPA: hypothetical protein VF680_11575 [Allosphingosinicella sp.]|jgi:hypothetical protein